MLAAGLLACCHPAAADVFPETCGDQFSELGKDCSLKELDGSRVIIDNVEFYNITAPLGDRDAGYPISENIRVVAVGEGTSRPGLRFEAENGAMNHDPCVDGDPLALANIAYFVRASNALLQDIEVNHVTLAGAGSAVTDIGEYEFSLAENFSGGFAFSSQDPLPLSLEIDDLNFIAVEVGAAARSPGAFSLPEPERCGTKAGISWFEQRVELNNVPPLPPGITESEDIACGVIDPDGVICPNAAVTADSACSPETAGLGVVDVAGVSVAELSSCAEGEEGTSLEIPIDTPLSSFEIWFDFRFDASARLDVFIDDTLIGTVQGVPNPTFARETILVNDPDLMGLEQAKLKFVLVVAAAPNQVLADERYQPAAAEDDPVIEIANVFSPVYQLEKLQVRIGGSVSIEGQGPVISPPERVCNHEGMESKTCDEYRNDCSISIGTDLVCTNPGGAIPGSLFGTGLFLGDQTEFIQSIFGSPLRSTSMAMADSRAFAQFEGVGGGNLVQIDNDLDSKIQSTGADGENILKGDASSYSLVRYRAISNTVPDGALIPLNYRLRINGTVSVLLNTPLDSNFDGSPEIKLMVQGRVVTRRAKLDDSAEEMKAEERGTDGTAFFVLDPEHPAVKLSPINTLGMFMENNCPLDQYPNDPEPGTPAVKDERIETFENGKLRSVTFEIDQAFCRDAILHAAVGDYVLVDLRLVLVVNSDDSEFDGAIIADFSDTAFASISTPVAGIEFVSEELEALVGPAFAINAGLNDAWFESSTPGQGFLIIVFPNIGQVFLAWFTFDTERPDDDTAMLGESSHRWLTAQGPYDGNTANLTVYLTEGGVFDAADPPAVTNVVDPVGTITIVWEDCETGTLTYDLDPPGVQGQIPIRRIVPDNVALCEELAAQ